MSQLSPTSAAYIRAVNDHDAAGFLALFADEAVVNDNDREFSGRAAIKAWSEREIFAVNVTLDVVKVIEGVLRTKVDGNFDRRGLPDPVIIDQDLVEKDGKIVRLVCRLAGAK